MKAQIVTEGAFVSRTLVNMKAMRRLRDACGHHSALQDESQTRRNRDD